MGSLLNGVVNYNTWLPEQSMYFDGTKDFFEKYTKRAVEAKVDPLGFYIAPYGYAMGQMIEQAVNATKSLDQKGLAKYLRENTIRPSSVRSPMRMTANGSRARPLRRNSAASRTRTSTSSASRVSRSSCFPTL